MDFFGVALLCGIVVTMIELHLISIKLDGLHYFVDLNAIEGFLSQIESNTNNLQDMKDELEKIANALEVIQENTTRNSN